jgi:cytochrome b561
MAHSLGSAPERYDGFAMALHWLSVALVFALLATGPVMTRLTPGGADQFALYQLHKSLGVTLLLLTVVRWAWRWHRRPPLLPAHVSAVVSSAAELMHVLLYVFLVAVPLAGWALVSSSTLNIQTSMFGLATWPHLPVLSDLDPESRARIEPVLSRVHMTFAYVFAGLVLLHSAAAIWHGRPVMARMLPVGPSHEPSHTGQP